MKERLYDVIGLSKLKECVFVCVCVCVCVWHNWIRHTERTGAWHSWIRHVV